MKLPKELDDSLRAYQKSTPWYGQWPLIRRIIFFGIPLIVIILAAAVGLAVGDWIASKCAAGTMPASLQWLCF